MFDFFDNEKNPFLFMMNMMGNESAQEETPNLEASGADPMQFMQQMFLMQMQMMQTMMMMPVKFMQGMAGMMGAATDALLNQKISAKLNTPAMLSMGVYHDVNEKLALMAEYQRVFWSSFQNLTFVSRSGNNNPATPGYISRVNESWRDTNFYALGLSYMLDDQWKLRLGIAYDQSAVRLKHRTPRIPDSDRIWFSGGLSYQYNDQLSFSTAYTYIKAHNATMNTAFTGNNGKHVTAEYRNSIKAFAFGVTYNF